MDMVLVMSRLVRGCRRGGASAVVEIEVEVEGERRETARRLGEERGKAVVRRMWRSRK